MKKVLVIIVFFLCGLSVFSQTPRYTRERQSDGNWAYIFPSENDAILLLNSNYRLPDTVWIIIQNMRGLYLEETPLGLYILRGTRFGGENCPMGTMTIAVLNYYNFNRNATYTLLWKREINQIATQFRALSGGSGIVYSALLTVIQDSNGNMFRPNLTN